ncbi:MAG TPA: DUF1501 domain-containing protein [Acetobacteraceae bacterium]|nr:DUF1501 domain-containing protein [Acetobacteraceae bacterium]
MVTLTGVTLTRRSALLGLAGAVTLGRASLAVAAAPTDRRFVVVILRGALDGMAAVVPYGDPGLAALRAALVPPGPGQANGLLELGGFYALHPSLANLHGMFKAGELLPVHAVAGPTRVRSHFEAQDCLESGADHRMTSGWLNRAVAALPNAAHGRPEGDALAIGVSVPLLLRGPATVGSWAPHGVMTPPAGLYAQIAALNHADRITGPAIAEGLRERGFTAAVMAGDDPAQPMQNRYGFPALAGAAGEMLRAPDGPRVAALELDGWDTHQAQVPRLAGMLRQLDGGLAALKRGLGPAWRQTAVLVMTEFGRTARVNGTKGTDHGTATVAFVLGGAVAGGRVAGEWPGLGPGKLYENRDLAPTTDLRSVAKGLLAQHLGVPGGALSVVFPDSGAVGPMGGLVRS